MLAREKHAQKHNKDSNPSWQLWQHHKCGIVIISGSSNSSSSSSIAVVMLEINVCNKFKIFFLLMQCLLVCSYWHEVQLQTFNYQLPLTYGKWNSVCMCVCMHVCWFLWNKAWRKKVKVIQCAVRAQRSYADKDNATTVSRRGIWVKKPQLLGIWGKIKSPFTRFSAKEYVCLCLLAQNVFSVSYNFLLFSVSLTNIAWNSYMMHEHTNVRLCIIKKKLAQHAPYTIL